MSVLIGDEVVVLDRDRRRGRIEVIDARREPGPTVRVQFDDDKLPDTGWYYETNLVRVRP